MAHHFIMLTVEAPDGAPVSEVIEELCHKQGWRVLEDDEVLETEDDV